MRDGCEFALVICGVRRWIPPRNVQYLGKLRTEYFDIRSFCIWSCKIEWFHDKKYLLHYKINFQLQTADTEIFIATDLSSSCTLLYHNNCRQRNQKVKNSNFIPPSQNRLHSHRVYIQTLIHCATVSLLLPISLLCHFCIKSSYTRTYNTEGKRILPRISRLYSKMDGPHKWIHVIYIFFQ